MRKNRADKFQNIFLFLPALNQKDEEINQLFAAC